MASTSAPSSGAVPINSVRFPLWLKLGLVLGASMGVLILLVGWFDLQESLARDRKERPRQLMGLARTGVQLLDGQAFASLRQQSDMQSPVYAQASGRLRQFARDNDLKWVGSYFQRGEYLFYVTDSDPGPLPISYPLFDVPEALLRAFAGKVSYTLGRRDEWGIWDGGYAPVRDRAGRVVGVVEVTFDTDQREELTRSKLRSTLLELTGACLAAMLISVLFSRYLARHLRRLATAALAAAVGDLDQDIHVNTSDEVGQLGAAFERMIVGLKERDFIRDTFGRYMDEEVAREILASPEASKLGGDLKRVTIMMTDLRGFTSMTERVSPQVMVRVINLYLDVMSKEIIRHHGTITEFLGDGILALFGAPHGAADDELRAAACAASMQLALHEFNRTLDEPGLPGELEMGIGLATGEVVAGNLGSEKRMKYGVVGDAINLAARLQSMTVGGQVFLSETTYQAIADRIEVEPPQEVQVKGKARALKVYELRAVGVPYGLRIPGKASDGVRRPVQLPMQCWSVQGSRVNEEVRAGTLVTLGERTATAELEKPLAVMANLKLTLRLGSGPEAELLEDLYAKVVSVEDTAGGCLCELHFTSVPEAIRPQLAALLTVDV